MQKCCWKSKFATFQSSPGYSHSLITLLNLGNHSWSWIPKNHIQVEKDKENSFFCLMSTIKWKSCIFMSWSCSDAKTKKCRKKVRCKSKVVVLFIKPISFLTFSLLSLLSDLKVYFDKPCAHRHPLEALNHSCVCSPQLIYVHCHQIRGAETLVYLVCLPTYMWTPQQNC